MRHLRIFILSALTILFSTCESDYKGSYSSPELDEVQADQSRNGDMGEHLKIESPRTPPPPPPPPPPTSSGSREDGQNANLSINRKVIYTGSIRMQVDSLSMAMAQITDLVSKAGGYISSQHVTNDHYEKEAKLIIRLPVEGFQPAMNSVTQLAKFVNSQNLDSRDVSAQWIDLESRLKTKRDVRDRYVEILRKRAAKVEDILAAEDKIRVITEEIEAKEGQLRYLRDQVGMSTLNLTMYQTQEYRTEPVTYRKSFGQKILDSLAGGFELIQGLLLFALSIWPLYFLIPLLVWLYRKWRN